MSVGVKLYLVWLFCTTLTSAHQSNHIPDSTGRTIATSDQLVSSVFLECFDGKESFSRCVRTNVLEYLDNVTGKGRSLEIRDDHQMDQIILKRIQRYLETHRFTLQLPEYFFQRAKLIFRPARSMTDFDVEFPAPPSEEEDKPQPLTTARDMMKQKMLLPFLMMIKLKLKALIPVLLAVVHLKATKALILSKIAIALVVGFLAFQLLMKKTAMNMMPMPMEMPVTPLPYAPPSSSYGPPATISSYDAPIYEAPASWEPAAPASWEPAAPSGPYTRSGWDAQPLAYSGYVNQQSNQSPSTQ